MSEETPLELRVLLCMPVGRDAPLAESLLSRAGIKAFTCPDLHSLEREAEAGAGAILVAEESLDPEHRESLARFLSRQPSWSDLPVIVLTRTGADSRRIAAVLDTLGSVTLLERPVRMAALFSTVRVALRSRERQYQIRSQLAQLQAAEHSLREADRQKDEFLAMLAHELRNPLAPIRNALHIQRLKNADAPADPLREMMERQVSHMVRLVDDLMEISRITRGKIAQRIERVDLAAVIQAALETSRPLIDARKHTLSVALPAEPVELDADPVRLSQVFANLLNNAAKYIDGPGQISLTARRLAQSVEVSVRDNGIGIPVDKLTRVFDSFTQLDHAPLTSYGGLGIGLTLVRKLVDMHGGTVSARSEGPGTGSEFVVRLPLAGKAPERVSEMELSAASSRSG